jgi:hypothetical protein
VHMVEAERGGTACRVDRLLESWPRPQSTASQAPLPAAHIPSRSDSFAAVRSSLHPPLEAYVAF